MASSKTRKPLTHNTRTWRRMLGSGYTCSSCGKIVNFLGAVRNKTTQQILCDECYENGKGDNNSAKDSCSSSPEKRRVIVPSLSYRVCNSEWEQVASVATPYHAGMLLASMNDIGATVRYGKEVVWTEGPDGRAGESYDFISDTIDSRVKEINTRREQRREGICPKT